MLIKIVTRKYDYREKNGSVWALFFRRYRRLTVQELSIMKFPFGSSEKDTDAQTHCRNSPAARAKSLEWTYRVSSQESVLADVSVALAKETSDSQAELQGFSFFLHHIPTIVLQETPTQNPTWKQCKCDTVFTFLHFYEALHHKTAQQDSIVRSQQLTSFSVHSMSLLVDISLLSSLLSISFNATACVAINQITVWIFIILWHKKYVSNKWSFGIGRKFVLFSSFNSVFVQTVIGSAGLGICWIPPPEWLLRLFMFPVDVKGISALQLQLNVFIHHVAGVNFLRDQLKHSSYQLECVSAAHRRSTMSLLWDYVL